MGVWEKILVGVFAVLIIFWFAPGIKTSLAQSRDAKDKDWLGALIPLVVVVLFVILLLSLV